MPFNLGRGDDPTLKTALNRINAVIRRQTVKATTMGESLPVFTTKATVWGICSTPAEKTSPKRPFELLALKLGKTIATLVEDFAGAYSSLMSSQPIDPMAPVSHSLMDAPFTFRELEPGLSGL